MSIAADSKTITIMGLRKPQLLIKVVTPAGVPVGGIKVDVGSVVWELTPLRLGLFTKTTDDNGLVYIDGMLPGGYLVHAYTEDLHVQGTPSQVSIDLLGKATPDTLTLTLHAAPWYYTLKVTYPTAIGVTLANIMAAMLDVEKKYLGAHFDEVRVIGPTTEIDFHITEQSPLVITTALLVGIFAGLAILIIAGVVGWILVERFVPPAEKKPGEFIAPDGTTYTDQEALATYLISKGDPDPYQCAYQGCNLRFATKAEKLSHMETFHKVEKIPIIEIAGIIAFGIVVISIASMLLGRPVILPAAPPSVLRAEEEQKRVEEKRRRAEEEQRRLKEERPSR